MYSDVPKRFPLEATAKLLCYAVSKRVVWPPVEAGFTFYVIVSASKRNGVRFTRFYGRRLYCVVHFLTGRAS